MEQSILSSKGRIRRTTYWTRALIVFVINIGMTIIQGSSDEFGVIIMTAIISLLLSIFIIIQGVKRMHDVNKNGWYIIIPIYNLILAFTPGTVGANKYGADPKSENTEDFVPDVEGTNLTSNQQTNNTVEILVFISIVYWFTMNFANFIIQTFVDNWYDSPAKFFQIGSNIVFAIVPIIFALSVRNKNLKIIAIILSALLSALILYGNIEWLIQELK